MMNTIYITTDERGCATGASRAAGAYEVPLTATGKTWARGIERVYVAYGRDGQTIIAAFGTRADMEDYVAETGNKDTARIAVDRPMRGCITIEWRGHKTSRIQDGQWIDPLPSYVDEDEAAYVLWAVQNGSTHCNGAWRIA
jgi:hypothetical protein